VLDRDDVIDFKGSIVVALRHPAVLAAFARTLPNDPDKRCIHAH
jgi:hypothetical protein